MSTVINQDLAASGVAPVICVLEEGATGAKARAAAKKIQDHFVTSELSQPSALAVALAAPGDGPERPVPPPVRVYENLGLAYGTVTRQGLAALRKDPAVTDVSGAPQLSPIRPERVATARLTRRHTWGLDALGAPQIWNEGLTGAGVLVGHLDTGVDGRHPALRGALEAFAEFDNLGFVVEPTPRAHDTGDHGTHTAATIAGRPVNRRHVGVAPGAKLASAIVIEGGDAIARVLGGMDWAVGLGVRVLSMSLGFRGMWDDFLPLTRVLRARDVVPAFAVGNEGPGTSRSPGNYPEALSIGASDRTGRIADFSSSQRFRRRQDAIVPDLVAPGVGTISARPGGGYQTMDGTSMATPHVAGLAALLLEARNNASVADVERAIFQSSALGPLMPPERANRGIPDGPRALEILTGG
jgi:subtilisin